MKGRVTDITRSLARVYQPTPDLIMVVFLPQFGLRSYFSPVLLQMKLSITAIVVPAPPNSFSQKKLRERGFTPQVRMLAKEGGKVAIRKHEEVPVCRYRIILLLSPLYLDC